MDQAEQLARRFHETYEKLAPQFGYKTREDSAVPWEDVPEQNRQLMIATCLHLIMHGTARPILRTIRASRYVTLAGIVVVCMTVAWVAWLVWGRLPCQ